MSTRPGHLLITLLVAGILLASMGSLLSGPYFGAHATLSTDGAARNSPGSPPSASSNPVANFTASINRLVELVAAAGGGILALVWARVAVSWFSNDITKKVQAKDRARDALVGTLVFTAAISGLVWGLAQWVLTGA